MIYDGTDGLIFTVSLVGYDRVSENARTNRMEVKDLVFRVVVMGSVVGIFDYVGVGGRE